MIRLSRVLIVAGAAAAFAACSEMQPTTPEAAPAGDVVASATAASASCTIAPNGTSYDVTVTWSGFSVSGIELWQVNAVQPLAQAVLAHPTRKGSMTFTVTSAPDYAQVTGRQTGLRVACVTVI